MFLARNDGSPLRASDAVKVVPSVAFQPRCEVTEEKAPRAAVPFARLWGRGRAYPPGPRARQVGAP